MDMADSYKDTADTLPIVLKLLEDALPEQDCGRDGYLQRLRHYRDKINCLLDNREQLVEENDRVPAKRHPDLSSDDVLSGGNNQSTEDISDTDQQSIQAIPNSEHRRLTAHFQHNIKVNSHCYVAGMALLNENYIVFCDTENNVVKVVDIKITKNESVISITQLTSSPRGVTCLFGGYIAVTLPGDKQINIFKYQNNYLQNETKFDIEHDCHGIDYMDDRILVTYVTPPGFGVFDFVDTPSLTCTRRFEICRTTYNSDTTEIHARPLYIKGFKLQNNARFIIVSDEKSGYVTVHSWDNGSLIHKLKDPQFRQPRGLTLYNADYLLVAFRKSDSIVMFKVNEDGQLCFDCQVLDQTLHKNMCKPCALLFSAEKRVLYLSCQYIEAPYELKNNIQVYEMS